MGSRRAVLILACFALFITLWSTDTGSGQAPRKVKTKLGIEMALMPAGEFVMGSAQGRPDEQPTREVKLSSFYIDTHLVTQEQYQTLMRANPSRWKGAKNPVEQIRWSDAVRYLNARSEAEGLEPCYDLKTWKCDFGAGGYRLPTEAEWEYACRAGTKTRYFFGDDAGKLGAFAWYKDNSGSRPRPVGQKLPNPWGLHDICGNVAEWCNDHYQPDAYKSGSSSDPRGPAAGKTRVLRGGSWDSTASRCTSSYRDKNRPGYADVCFGYDVYGFRAVRRAGAR
ncbi:MAG: formylglycine-generating enzyme family protein [Candidatus Brocadiaceae bacterium]|jgi:formylglycine-generating enzyme required for sulfatase activity